MKRYLILIALLCAVLGAGCVKDPETAVPGGGKEGQISLYISRPERTQVTTRAAAADETIDPQSVCVLLFSSNDADSVLYDWGFATPIDLESCYGIKLPEHAGACYAEIVVNFRSGIETASAGWEKGNTTLADVRQGLITAALPTKSGIITAMPDTHPMTGGFDMPGGVGKNTTIGSSASPVVLTPATVKLTVRNQVPTGSYYTFELQGASLFNAPDRGYVMPSATVSGIDLLPYGDEGDITHMMAATETVEGVVSTRPLYCYESAAANATSVIIKALYNNYEGYYRLNLFNADKSALRDLTRGYHYKIVIRTVQTAGYRTVAEAMANPASNGILYDIESEDPDSYDIITNGAQYLGVSNSEYWMYNSNYVNQFESSYNESENIATATPFTVTILTYTANRTWQPGEVVASKGIRLQAGDGTQVSSLALPLPATENATVRRELKAFFDDDFTEGSLDIRIGDLHKIVKVRREHSASILGESFPLGKDVVYASANPIDNAYTKTDRDVFGLTYSPDGDFRLGGKGTAELDPSQNLYLRVRSRFENKSADYCYSTIYLHRNTRAGRVKIDMAADMHGNEIWGDYSEKPQVEILGAFWKNNERGERLAQIPQSYITLPPPNYGRWQVKVIRGEDFIRLDNWDKSLTMTDGVFDGDPEVRTVEGDKTQIFGKDFTVRFRIGLTGTNENKPNRYGLIQLIYVEKRQTGSFYDKLKLSCFIFVRQGETPDNLLTPGQSYVANGTTFVAPDVKFSPYELIDPKLGEGGSDVSNHTLLADDERAVLAPYPSWYGYELQWGQRRLIHPSSIPEALTGWLNYDTDPDSMPTEYREICPEGYITPPSAIDGIPLHYGLRCSGMTSFGNLYGPGTYLDGYQDRRMEVTGKDSDFTSTDQNMVFIQNNAYKRTWAQYLTKRYGSTEYTADNMTLSTGYLAYNPETMASLYFPIVFGRAFANGSIWGDRLIDPYLIFWTQTPNANNATGGGALLLLGPNYSGAMTTALHKSYAVRVRCIKDPNKP